MGTQSNYAKTILDSIDVMVERALTTAKFDKTVSASIVSCMDAATGKYKVKYQDGTYQATAENIDTKYSDGANVYMLVPQGDFTKPKKIIGEVTTSTTSDTKTTEEAIVNYNKVGSNVVDMKTEIGISSYNCDIDNVGKKVLYVHEGSNNLLTVNNTAFKQAASKEDCRFFEIEATFRTNLPIEHQSRGEYALLVTLAYTDDKKKLQFQDYKLDINAMMGNPYQYTNGSTQKTMLNLPVGTFEYIKSIAFVAYDFDPQLAEIQKENIFVKDIHITGMAPAASPYFNTYVIKIDGTKGLEFSNNVTKTVLSPEVQYQDRKVDISSANIFWFRENSNVTTAHRHYLQYGGKGWACLNKSHQATGEDGKTLTTVFSSQKTLEVKRNTEFMPASMKYKCVIILTTGVMISKEFDITDRDYHHKISISTTESQFTNGSGATTLTVSFKDKDNKTINTWKDKDGKTHQIRYYWHTEAKSGAVDNLYYYTNSGLVNTIETLDSIQITEENYTNYDIYTTALGLKNRIEEGIALEVFGSGAKFNTHNFDSLDDPDLTAGQKAVLTELAELIESGVFTGYLNNKLKTLNGNKILTASTYQQVLNLIQKFNTSYYITYLHNQTFYELPARIIAGTVNYVCTVWGQDAEGSYTIYLGSAEVQLSNSYTTQGSANKWSADIVNGDQIFKYDSEGRSPITQTSGNPNPQTVLALKFNVFNDKGKQIDDAKIVENSDEADGVVAIDEWTWYIPSSDTLIDVDAKYKTEEALDSNGWYRINNVKELPFSISASFRDNCNQNKIKLRVKYGENAKTGENKYVWSYTNFSFIKDGSNGTNGTEYFCKVTPNIDSLNLWPAIIVRGEDRKLNFTPTGGNASSSGKWFKAEVFNNQNKIDINDVSIQWKNLRNEYVANIDTEDAEIRTTARHFIVDSDGTCHFRTRGEIDEVNHPSSIIQAEVVYTPETDSSTNVSTSMSAQKKIYGSTTLDTIIMYNDNYSARIKSSTGYNEVVYDANGGNPAFPNRPFEVQLYAKDDSGNFNYDDNLANNVLRNKTKGTPFKCVFSVYGNNKMFTISNVNKLDKKVNVKDMSEEDLKKTFPTNSCTVRPKENYSGLETNCGLRVDIYRYNPDLEGWAKENQYPNEALIATIFHPIQLILNRYAHSALNDWNGNAIEINDGEGIILAPQMGAGYKEEDNSFTGMVMGTSRTKSGSSFDDETGLMGYKGGVRTIFLDAETGKAEFGRAGAGQIQLHPGDYNSETHEFTQSDATIRGGAYDPDKGTGMQINLTNPEIRWGNENFIVTPEGQLKAKNVLLEGIYATKEGAIGPWLFDDFGMAKTDGEVVEDIIEDVFDGSFNPTNDYTIVTDEEDWDDDSPESEVDADGEDTTAGTDDTTGVDGKHRTFTGATVPKGPYSIGDLWYRDIVESDSGQISTGTGVLNEGQILRCITNLPTKDAAGNLNHWTIHGSYVAEQNLVNLRKAYENYANTEVGKLDTKTQAYLSGGGGTLVEDNYVISPYIGGGYLHITDTDSDASVTIDPANKGETGLPFRITNTNGDSVFGVDKNGRAYIGATVNDKGEATSGWFVGNNLLHSLYNGKYTILQSGVNQYAIAAGATSADNGGMAGAPFYVTHTGKLYASDAEIGGKITATSGEIGPLEIRKRSDGTYSLWGHTFQVDDTRLNFAIGTKTGGQLGYAKLYLDEYGNNYLGNEKGYRAIIEAEDSVQIRTGGYFQIFHDSINESLKHVVQVDTTGDTYWQPNSNFEVVAGKEISLYSEDAMDLTTEKTFNLYSAKAMTIQADSTLNISTAGSISLNAGDYAFTLSATTGRFVTSGTIEAGKAIVPSTDGQYACGTSTNEWSMVAARTYYSGGELGLRYHDDGTTKRLLLGAASNSYRTEIRAPKSVWIKCAGVTSDDSRYSLQWARLNFGTEASPKWRGCLRPTYDSEDNTASSYTNLGSDNYRWRTIFLINNPNVSSDRRYKTNIQNIDARYLTLFDKLNPVSYKRIDDDSDEKKTYLGFIAQDVEQALIDSNLTAADFRGLNKAIKRDPLNDNEVIYDQNGEYDYEYSLVYEQFIALNTAKIKQLESIIEQQQKQIDLLLSKLG